TYLLFLSNVFFVGVNAHGDIGPGSSFVEKKANEKTIETDVLVYGATPSGIMAAYSVKKAGHSVLVVEPGRWVGGILGAGLKPMQDMPNYEAVGGTTRELMLWVGVDQRKKALTIDEVWQISLHEMIPKDVRGSFLRFLDKNDIEIIYDYRINRSEERRVGKESRI